jgi:hypothetical protein
MNHCYVAAALLALACVTTACSPDGDAEPDPLDDPTSRESLRKAEPLSMGCAYVETEHSSYESASSVKRTPRCAIGVRCVDLQTPNGTAMSDGYGGVYNSYTSYTDEVDFVGTCDAQKPISCKGRSGADACEACTIENACRALVLCENDPNCLAIATCVQTCGADSSCARRCVDNGEPEAHANFVRLAEVVTDECAASCK